MYVQDNDRPDTILDSAISLSGVAKSFAVPPTEPRWFSGFQDTISATSVYLQHSLAGQELMVSIGSWDLPKQDLDHPALWINLPGPLERIPFAN